MSWRSRIVAIAQKYWMPAVFPSRTFIESGAAIVYEPDRSETRRQFGIYVGKVLKGARPAELPVMTPTKFALIVNLKSAKASGLIVPPTLLARADEVIE